LITRNNATEWVDQNSLVPTTTNALELTGNTLTSTVNNISSSVDLEKVMLSQVKLSLELVLRLTEELVLL
ncbi:hypothetical protein VSP20_12990, partial [Myroides phaeus]|uniref:hypothetical protein n=1 Tax=Myroides phaeus TaxID=702745 RepID=UPI002DBF047E